MKSMWMGVGLGGGLADRNVFTQSLNIAQKERRLRWKSGWVRCLAPKRNHRAASSLCIPWGLARNAEPQAPPQTHWMRINIWEVPVCRSFVLRQPISANHFYIVIPMISAGRVCGSPRTVLECIVGRTSPISTSSSQSSLVNLLSLSEGDVEEGISFPKIIFPVLFLLSGSLTSLKQKGAWQRIKCCILFSF